MNAVSLKVPKLRLYHYWRSSSSWRVRWAFAYKEIACDFVAVDLLPGASESAEHRKRNPLGYVPVLEFQGQPHLPYLGESIAIIEWAEEVFPEPSLLPGNPLERARARQLAEIINSGTQPLQNLNAQDEHTKDPVERKRWTQHWIRNGLQAYETLVAETAGPFSMGDQLTLADLFLVPQCYNAARNEVGLDAYPNIARIQKNALATPSCMASHPDRFQPK
jgi:maleylacetoacetate isomerase